MIRTIALLLTVCFWLPFFAVAQTPVPGFSADPVAGCSPLVVRFTDESTGQPTTWFWEFGNGATSTLKNPSTTFFTPGRYTVKLTVTNVNGSQSVTRSDYITVFANPQVTFAADDSTGCFPFPVRFTDGSTPGVGTTITSWLWDFGDGTQSNEQHPQNTYVNNGNYSVLLKVTTDKGCWSSATKQGYIKIDGSVKADFTVVKPPLCQTPFHVSFTNTSAGPGILNYKWDFGDGATSTEENPVHTYTTTGTYSVTLITQSSEGCTDTVRYENLLDLQNTATAFTAPDSICLGEVINFANSSSAAALSSRWNFGDGTTSNAGNPVKTYTDAGIYTVQLIQDYGFCTDTSVKDIRVSPRPAAGFTADANTQCQSPLTVSFQNTSTGALQYYWDFGDSTTSTEANPVHTYTGFGSFSVTLVATNAAGCTDTFRMPSLVNINKPLVQFNSLPTDGCVPTKITFDATVVSSEPITSYLWDLGNGTTSTEVNPSTTYAEQGRYTVKLTVTTAGGCTETYTMTNAVSVGRRPATNFHAVPAEGCASQPIQFVNNVPEYSSLFWLFGDGGSATDAAPLYQYADTGTFTVMLIAENNGCKDTLEIPDMVTIKAPIASFSFQTDCANKLQYAFTDQSIGAATWHWDFGDGTTSTEQNPKHTYAGFGAYSVQLTVTNDTCSYVSMMVVNVSIGKPGFAASPAAVCKGTPVLFTADSTNATNIISYSWNFGNGTTGSGKTASTVYRAAGIYTVILTVRDINGCVDTVIRENIVRVHGPTAALTASNNIGCKGLQARFADASTDDGFHQIVSWEWNFGDGTGIQNNAATPVQHVYDRAGFFDVRLKVSDQGGCTDSIRMPALVQIPDVRASFASTDTMSCPGAQVRFTNTSLATIPYASVWDFGDGKTSGQQNPVTAYAADSLYSVKLIVTDANGCTDSVTRQEYIAIKHPKASFTVNDSISFCIPFQVLYTNTSTYYTQQVWDLNGGTSRLPNPIQYYNTAGFYTTRLVVTSPGGCTDTATMRISVFDVSSSSLAYLPLSGCKPLAVDLTAKNTSQMDYIWDFGDGTILNSSDTVSKHIYTSFGDFVPKIILKNNSGCVVAITGPDTIRIKGATAKFGLDRQLLCDSGFVQFIDSTTFNSPVASYQWNFGDGTTSSESSPSHHYTAPGLYPVSLSVQTGNECKDTFRLQHPVKVVASPAIRITGDSVICAGESLIHRGVFERTDTAAVQWAWRFPNGASSSQQSPQRQVYNQAGTFRVESVATNSSGCSDTAYQVIHVNPIPTVTLPSTITTLVGTPVILPAIYSDTMQSYRWRVPDGLNCTTCPQPIATPKFDTRYTVQVTDRNGCSSESSVQVMVLCNNENVFIPNTFSPNGDGSNDVFYVRGKGLSRVKAMRIFNRWGQVVFERVNFNVNDAAAGWDGRFKGVKPVPDVYVYQVEIYCDNSQVVKLEGNLALIQ